MNVYLVKYKKRIEYEGDEFIFYAVAAENGYDAMRLIDDTHKMGRSNLNVSGSKILLEYEA